MDLIALSKPQRFARVIALISVVFLSGCGGSSHHRFPQDPGLVLFVLVIAAVLYVVQAVGVAVQAFVYGLLPILICCLVAFLFVMLIWTFRPTRLDAAKQDPLDT